MTKTQHIETHAEPDSVVRITQHTTVTHESVYSFVLHAASTEADRVPPTLRRPSCRPVPSRSVRPSHPRD